MNGRDPAPKPHLAPGSAGHPVAAGSAAMPAGHPVAAGLAPAAPRFLRACRREPADCTPIWLMRQAGRYLPEYRRLRSKYSFLELVKTPDLACEVTLQPVRRFDLDAAIIFSDILPVLEAVGLHLTFSDETGPRLVDPIVTPADLDRLAPADPREALAFTLDAIRLVRHELAPPPRPGRPRADSGGFPAPLPLIGFGGGPFTLACYALGGPTGGGLPRARSLMQDDPAGWDRLLSMLADVVGSFLVAQAKTGADALQLFDSWAGYLTREDYRNFALPYTKMVLDVACGPGIPVIHYCGRTASVVEEMPIAGGDVIGVDSTVPVATAQTVCGDRHAFQGNLDARLLLRPWPEVESAAAALLDEVAGRSGHVFNLGEGVPPAAPPDTVARLVDLVHARTAQA